jgi:hypothetical protein
VPLRLERALKREVDIGGVTHTVTVSPLGVRLVRKGFRKGVALSWRRLLALAVDPGNREPGLGSGEDAG